MNNTFISLSKKFNFKTEALRELFEEGNDDKAITILDQFFGQEDQNVNEKSNYDYCTLFLQLLPNVTDSEKKQKILVSFVYFVVSLQNDKCLEILAKSQELKSTIVFKVKLFSLVFKSSSSSEVKKWLINSCLELIGNQPKTSHFSSFVENFDRLMACLGSRDIQNSERMKMYAKFVTYLEKHIIYKKLRPVYIAKSLSCVTKENANDDQVSSLIIKTIKGSALTQEALELLNHIPLKQNKCYLSGQFENINNLDKATIESAGISFNELCKKIKINSIPRLFSSTKSASYSQVAAILDIKKQQVQPYIIEAIQAGLIKAKLDQFEQTILINRVEFKCLRGNQKVKVQKDLTATIERLQRL